MLYAHIKGFIYMSLIYISDTYVCYKHMLHVCLYVLIFSKLCLALSFLKGRYIHPKTQSFSSLSLPLLPLAL